MKRYFFLILFSCVFVLICSAQQKKFICPLSNGKVRQLKELIYSHSDPTNAAMIESRDSLVVAGAAGKVIKVARMEQVYAVLVRTDSMTVLVYGGLSRINVKEDDWLIPAGKIGVATRLEEGLYELRFGVRKATESIDPRPFLTCSN